MSEMRKLPEHVARAFRRTQEEWLDLEEGHHQMERSICETVRGHEWVVTTDRVGQRFYSCFHCAAEAGRAPVGVA